MDYFNSLDFERPNKKSKRVRSWYLFEQYKSLKNNPPKERFSLKRHLRKEQEERKIRRSYYNHISDCRSESYARRSICSFDGAPLMNLSADDCFEDYFDFEDDEYEIRSLIPDGLPDFDKEYVKENINFDLRDEYLIDRISDKKNEHMDRVGKSNDKENMKTYKYLSEDIKKGLEEAKRDIKENIVAQLDTVSAEFEQVEECAEVSAYEESEAESYNEIQKEKQKNCNGVQQYQAFSIWSRLVSFAYQLALMQHGNCYSDCSNQISTAVLACDILRYSLLRLCKYLQPFVSPIKIEYEDDEIELLALYPKKNSKPKTDTKNRRKCYRCCCCYNHNCNKNHSEGNKRFRSESNRCKSLQISNDSQWLSEPWGHRRHVYSCIDCINSNTFTGLNLDNTKDKEYSSNSSRQMQHNLTNPMSDVMNYIDDILQLNYDDFKNI